ncbi:MAG: GGDEF domain-containing protein [Rhodocyclales bacterium]|nr:GGDEF domain-containing protein [Rhodocyclales bacterium]
MSNSLPLSALEIARETLRQLALKKLQPTPENYRTVFFEISGDPAISSFPDQELKAIQAVLPRKNAKQIRFARQLETAIAEKSWAGLQNAVTELSAIQVGTEVSWPDLLRNLLQQLDMSHAEMTRLQKKESLEHILSVSATSDLLFSRLQSLVGSWNKNTLTTPPVLVEDALLVSPVASDLAVVNPVEKSNKKLLEPPDFPSNLAALQGLLGQFLNNALVTVLHKSPDLLAEVKEISVALEAARDVPTLKQLVERFKRISYRAHFVVEDEVELKAVLLRLVQLIVDNISELVVEDEWLSGQIKVMQMLLNNPLELRQLDEVERRMKDVIIQQSMLKKNLTEANDRLKLMLAAFVDHLTNFSEVTGSYHGKIEEFSEKISLAKNPAEITDLLNEVMHETRLVQVDTARSRDEMSLMKNRVHNAEQEIARLHKELSATSQLIRHDQLTGVLNRKGLDEALQKEINRQQRQGVPLSLALLDVDNFKSINDTRGHSVGDLALVHLVEVVQKTLRPQDVLARYGGEEFIVLLPGTGVEDAVAAMMRVQRMLTREYFMDKDDKILITFSCGVVAVTDLEAADELIRRADSAMYLAKRSGKNRVVAA